MAFSPAQKLCQPTGNGACAPGADGFAHALHKGFALDPFSLRRALCFNSRGLPCGNVFSP